VVASVAEKLCKKLKPLELHGFELRVHASRYQELFSTFIHAFRNAVDHGIEPSEEREMMGKAPEGHIRATAESFAHKGGQWIRLKIEDDGGGISVEKIRAKMQSGPGGSKVQGMTDFEVMQQVFASGLSTKAEVGEFSGRGIGLNAVKIEAEQLGGRAWVESELGRGTKLIVEVPDLPRLAQQMAAA
jgi:two-component system chemotaxis sensor kinase CheA